MQRYIPFGYKIENGTTTVNDAEAAAVKTAFEMYIGGASYKKIAEYMESIGINYRQDSGKWDKNIVKRILENERYTGACDYPAIINKDIYTQVSAIISKKGSVQGKPHPLDSVKGKMVCDGCGSEYVRVHDKRRILTWYCKNRDCKESPLLSDDMVASAITDILDQLIANPMQIQAVSSIAEPGLSLKRLGNEINREFDQRELDKNPVTALMLELAGEKYKLCDDGASERSTDELREMFSRQKQIRKFHGRLFEKTVRRLHISKDGAIKLELINNQII